MKKNVLLGFLILFVINTASFAGLGDPKKESEKSATNNPKENKLSEEEISRLSKHADTDNLAVSSFSNNEKNDSKNNLKSPQEVYVENHHHHGYLYGGAGLILLIILIVVLV